MTDKTKVLEVLRQVEWVGDDWHLRCNLCGAWKSQGHYEGCKLAALLDEAKGLPTITVQILGPLEGLRAWLFGVLFQLGAALVGYDLKLVIDDGMGNVEKLRWDKH